MVKYQQAIFTVHFDRFHCIIKRKRGFPPSLAREGGRGMSYIAKITQNKLIFTSAKLELIIIKQGIERIKRIEDI